MAEGIRIPIPPGADLVQPYPVKLDLFEGPLDLLLHLIRKNEVDLRNIPVADICRQYHDYLVLMVELDLEVAAEFLYFEALLVQVKSQMLLPRAEGVEEGAADPRSELVNRLLEYRKIKGVAETLHEMEVERLGMWPRPQVKLEAVVSPEDEETDLSEVSLFDLLSFFKTTLERYRALHPPAMEISHATYSIKQKMEEMMGRVKETGRSALTEVFKALSGRAEAIATFLAVLELLRLGMVRAMQAEEFSEIYLEGTGSETSLESYEEAYR